MPIYVPLFQYCFIALLIIIFPCVFASILMLGTLLDDFIKIGGKPEDLTIKSLFDIIPANGVDYE